ncbi:MAG: TonB-dependent receptor plug domain-containing protein, partial [Pseudomonadota bacterium]|nr:TonB-dependent receptor plug domain-containing protein [Pseudomonadota bacterium]
MRSSFQRRLLASTLLLGLTTPAFAQTADDADEGTIVVTGSRIARPDLQQASPIAIVSAQELKLSGKVNVEAIINDLPQLVPSATGASNNPGGGVSTADLRGLGANRTLVLVNGRRYIS